MYVLGSLFLAAARVLEFAINLYLLILFVRVVISWFPSIDPYHPLVQVLRRLTDPLLDWIRRTLSLPPMGLDLSPLLAFLGLVFLKYFAITVLVQTAVRLMR